MRERLEAIERELLADDYRAGSWPAFCALAETRPLQERCEVTDDVDRVSNLLHRRKYPVVISLPVALAAEGVAVAAGAGLLAAALSLRSNLLAIGACALWATAFQPLVKMAVGSVLGVRYSHAYLWKLEPRFKMRYGTYLTTSRPARVLLHLAGCIGTPLGAWLVRRAAGDVLPQAALVSTVVFWLTMSSNVIFFAAGMAGLKKLGAVQVNASSAGSAALEWRGRESGG